MALDKVANVKRQHETDMTHAISYTYISRFYGIRYYCIYLSTYQFAQGFYVFSYAYLDTNLWISLHPAKRYINIGHRFCKYRLKQRSEHEGYNSLKNLVFSQCLHPEIFSSPLIFSFFQCQVHYIM